MENIATRDAYGRTLASLKNQNIVVLDADLAESTRTYLFKEKYPKRFFEFGISEADMIDAACGFASCGKIPFVSTFAVFASLRALDQIRNTVCVGNFNVKLVCTHAGLTIGQDGVSNMCLEDISIMRTLPNMSVIVPSDPEETAQVIKFASKYKGPMYIRLGRNKQNNIGDVFKTKTRFRFGKSQLLKAGASATIIACGYMVEKAMLAAEILESDAINVTVVNMSTIKPFDRRIVVNCPKPIVTVEDAMINGGLGSSVAEVIAEEGLKTKMIRLGSRDRFGQSGDPEELLSEYGLDVKTIVGAVKRVLRK